MTLLALQADYTWVHDRFERDVTVTFDTGSGRIVQVGPPRDRDAQAHLERRSDCALLPGMVNAHSHAFQRVLRGWTQWRPPDEKADFWSWREAMYRAVLRLSPEELYQVSHFCFIEMLRAGYTTAGEFHYVQRDPQGRAYGDANELAFQVVRAAQAAGLRIALLNVCYATGNVAEPLRPEQRRFATPELDDYLAATDALIAGLKRFANTSAGVAPHSVRAVPREWLRGIAEYARKHDLPLHMHVSEQPAEVEASQRHYGLRPAELLEREGLLSESFTAVHAIHLADAEVTALGSARAHVCACPTTERDLGDGILRARELLAAGASLCIGSDSQTVIDPWEELRSIEYHTRLATLRRVVLTDAVAAGRMEVAPLLMRAGTTGGARSLGIGSGRIAAGEPADFVLVDLEHPGLAGWNNATLGAQLTLSAPSAIVRDVWVGGVPRIRDGRHEALQQAQREFNQVSQRVLA